MSETQWYTPEIQLLIAQEAWEVLSRDMLDETEQELLSHKEQILQSEAARQVGLSQFQSIVALRQSLGAEHTEVTAARENFREKIGNMDRVEELYSSLDIPWGDTERGMQNMFEFLLSLPENERNEVYTLITDEFNEPDIVEYFSENWFLNSETFDIFQQFVTQNLGLTINIRVEIDESIEDSEAIQEDSEAIQEDSEAIQEDSEAIQEIQAHVRDFIIRPLDWVDIDENLGRILNQIANQENNRAELSTLNQELSQYLVELSQTPERFDAVLEQIETASPQAYTSLRDYTLSSTPAWSNREALRQSFARFEWHNNPSTSLLRTGIYDAWREALHEANRGLTGERLRENFDTSVRPPRRTVSIEGSDYQLPANSGPGELYPATLEYSEVSQELEPKLASIEAFIEFIEAIDTSLPIEEVRTSISQALESSYTLRRTLWLESFDINAYSSSEGLVEAIKNLIYPKHDELKERLDKAKRSYEARLQELHTLYVRQLQDEHEKQRSILLFLSKLGFDLLPQEFTDQIIREINWRKNIDLWNGMNINSDINIAKGEFWYQFTGLSENKQREAFVRLFNLMVTGVAEWDNALIANPEWFIVHNQRVVDTEAREIFTRKPDGILTSSGGVNIDRVRNNLWNNNDEQDSD